MLAAMTVVVVERIAQVAIEKPMRARVGDSMSTRPLGLVGVGVSAASSAAKADDPEYACPARESRSHIDCVIVQPRSGWNDFVVRSYRVAAEVVTCSSDPLPHSRFARDVPSTSSGQSKRSNCETLYSRSG